MQKKKKKNYPFDPVRALHKAQSPSGEAQPYLSHVTPMVPRSVHANKFMPIGLKLWALEGYTQTDKQTDRQSYFNIIDLTPALYSVSYRDTSLAHYPSTTLPGAG